MLQPPVYPPLADDDYSTSLSYQQQIETDIVTWESSAAVFTEIDRLEEAILKSPHVPLTGKTMVQEEELLDRLDLIRSSLPEALKTAQAILESKHQIIQAAQEQAQQLIAEANRQAYQIANELGIIDRSEAEARQIRQIALVECEQIKQQTMIEVERIRQRNVLEMERMREMVVHECQQIQDGADEYAHMTLSDMELQLKDVLRVIQRGKQRLNIESQALGNSQPSEREITNLGDRVIMCDRG